MDDRIRVSDADRDNVAAQVREHFAQGRLTADELDERLTATLSAKTFGDLGGVLADLPGTVTGQGAGQPPRLAAPGRTMPARGVPAWAVARRRPRILPLALVVLIVAVAIPSAGWLLAAFVKAVLVFWLIACLAGIFVAARFRRRMRREWRSGRHLHLSADWPGGPAQRWHQHLHLHQHRPGPGPGHRHERWARAR